MSRGEPKLNDFDVIEDAADSVQSGSVTSLAVDELSLGPLIEALSLKKSWSNLKLVKNGDDRYRLLQAAIRSPDCKATSQKFGAFYIGDLGEDFANAALAFGEDLARKVEVAGLTADPRRLLKGAVVELLTNIPEHAGQHARGIAAFEIFHGGVTFSVADGGQGVVAGYVSTKPELTGLTADDALVLAVVNHESRLLEPGRGTGFNTVASAMRSLDACLRVRSDDASIQIEGHPTDAEWALREQVGLKGFVVNLTLRWG